MSDEFLQDRFQVFDSDRDQVVEAFPANRPNEPLTVSIRLRSLWRRLQYANTEASKAFIDGRSENAVSVMDHESVRMIKSQEFAKLLSCPFRRRMVCDVEVQDAPGADLHGQEHIDDPEIRGDGGEEVTCHDCLGMIPHEHAPALAGGATWHAFGKVLPNGSRGYVDSEL